MSNVKVITDRSRHIALLKMGNKWMHLVRITAHGLETQRVSKQQLVSDWGELVSYPVDVAVAKFKQIAHNVGATDSALKIINER